jgi:glyoxylase-like metal-dependent hydrolase (beta-lactamase superfamily II)
VQISALSEPTPVVPPDGVHLVLANNPGPMTLAGTNTWVLGGRDGGRSTVVVDPGPPLPDHLAAIRAIGTPAAIILTHHHLDHSEAAHDLADEFGTPVYAALPQLALRSTPLVEGNVISHAGWALTVLATPGHTGDSVCLRVEGALFTGDTLLGGSTTIIAPPSGSLAEYFETMSRLAVLTDTSGFPGHGPAFSSVGRWAVHNAEYREGRLAQLVEIYGRESQQPDAPTLLARIASAAYGENGAPVTSHIEDMTRAQLTFLAQRGDISGWATA